MAFVVVSKESVHIELAHASEIFLTAPRLQELWEAFKSTEGNSSRRINAASFVHVVQRQVEQATTMSRLQSDLFTEDNVSSWFHAMDTDRNGWLEWADFESQLSHVATLRKYPTEYKKPETLDSVPASFPGGSKATWIMNWRRSVVCYTSKSPKLCTQEGTPLAALEGHQACVMNAVFLDALGLLLTFGTDRQVHAWDSKKATPLQTIRLSMPASTGCYEPTRRRIWIATHDGFLHAYDAALGDNPSPSVTSTDRHSDWITDMMFLEELSILVTASLDKTLAFWDSHGKMTAKKIGHSRGVYGIVYMRQTRTIFSYGQGREICAWNPLSFDNVPVQFMYGHEREMIALAPDLYNLSLISADVTGKIIIWDAQKYVRTQALDLSGMLLDSYPIFAATINPLSREWTMYSSTHVYQLHSSLSSRRLPRLGHRVRQLLAAESVRMIIVVFSHAMHWFDMVDGTLIKSLERPYGPSAAIHFVAFLDPLHALIVQCEHGRYFVHRLSPIRPLPVDAVKPQTLALRIANASVASHWTHVEAWEEPYLNRTVWKLCIVMENGFVLVHSFVFDDAAEHASEVISLCSKPPPMTTHFASLSAVAQSTTDGTGMVITRAALGVPSLEALRASISKQNSDKPLPKYLLACSRAGECFCWNMSGGGGSGSAAPAERLLRTSASRSVTSGVSDVVIVQSRNAAVLMHSDGISLIHCGSWTPFVDLVCDVFPQLPLLTSASPKEDLHAAACLSSSDSSFQLKKLLLLSEVDQQILLCTDYMAGVVVVDLNQCFSAFFSQQAASIEGGDSDEASCAAGDKKDMGIPPTLAKSFLVTLPHAFDSATSWLHRAVDCRTKEPVVIKVHFDSKRFEREFAVRDRLETLFGPWAIRTVAMQRMQAAPRARAACPAEDDEDHGERTRSSLDMTSEGHNSQSPSIGVAGEGDPVGVFVLETGEECLQDLIAQPGDLKTSRQLSITQGEKDHICLCLVAALDACGRAGLASMDVRPRVWMKVGDAWKLSSLDSLVPEGTTHLDPLSAAYCPPELCQGKANQYGVGSSSTTQMMRQAMSSSNSQLSPLATTLVGNLWTVAVIAFELHHGRRLLLPRNDKAASALFGEAETVPSERHMFEQLSALDDAAIEAFRLSTPLTTAAGVIVRHCLFKDPRQRMSSPSQLITLLSDSGFVLPPLSTLFTRPSCFRTGGHHALPRLLSKTITPVSLQASSLGISLTRLARCSLVDKCVVISCASCFACCDRDPAKSNEGALHLFNGSSCEHMGLLPPPEFGVDASVKWSWPLTSDTLARAEVQQEATGNAEEDTAEETTKAADEGRNSPISHQRDSKAARHHGGANSPDGSSHTLRLPRNWQTMDMGDLKSVLKEELDANTYRTVDEAVDRFVQTVTRKAPFFRGGEVEGDPMPVYAPDLDLFSSNSHAKKKLLNGVGQSAYERRRWANYWKDVQRQLGSQGVSHSAASALGREFLRRVPDLSNRDDDINHEIEALIEIRSVELQCPVSSSVSRLDESLLIGKDKRKGTAVKDVRGARSKQQHEEFVYTDNNLSSLEYVQRARTQSRLDSHDGKTELEAIKRELAKSQERSQQREKRNVEKQRGRQGALSDASSA